MFVTSKELGWYFLGQVNVVTPGKTSSKSVKVISQNNWQAHITNLKSCKAAGYSNPCVCILVLQHSFLYQLGNSDKDIQSHCSLQFLRQKVTILCGSLFHGHIWEETSLGNLDYYHGWDTLPIVMNSALIVLPKNASRGGYDVSQMQRSHFWYWNIIVNPSKHLLSLEMPGQTWGFPTAFSHVQVSEIKC